MQLSYSLPFFLRLLRLSLQRLNVAFGFRLGWFLNRNLRRSHRSGLSRRLSRFVLLTIRLPLRGRRLLSSFWLAGNHRFRLPAFMLAANDRRRLDLTCRCECGLVVRLLLRRRYRCGCRHYWLLRSLWLADNHRFWLPAFMLAGNNRR